VKQFRCVFSYPHGQVAAELPAADAAAALRRAVQLAGELRVTAVEIWDEDNMVRSRKLWAGPRSPSDPYPPTQH